MTQITRAQKGAVVAVGLALVMAGAAEAADQKRAGELQAIVDCRAVADNVARLACYDAAALRLDEAEAKGEVVVLDKAQRQQARREAFGFSLPSLSILGRGGDEEESGRMTFKAANAWQDGNGRWAVELDSGAVWRQIDDENIYREPKAGSSVELRSAAMGSYFMKVDGQRAVRARRER